MTDKKLDERDLKILAMLEQNSRVSVSDLARAVNLSQTAVRQRMVRLEKDVIDAYTITQKKTDKSDVIEALILLRLEGSFCKILKEEFGHLPEIRKFYSLAGDIDAALVMECASVGRLAEIADMLNEHELVKRVESRVITVTHINR